MEAQRPELEAALNRLLLSQGYSVRRQPDEHAGGKWLPRLSVDIDLTYVPVLSRGRSLGAIDKAMKRIAGRIENGIRGARVTPGVTESAATKLLVRADGAQTKIEVTPVMRGCAYEPELRAVSSAVEREFGFAEMPVLSFADLYGGKIVAALDRQHPRDLFDVKDLLANEGIQDTTRAAFIDYLLSHGRPMAEVLAARPRNIGPAFASGFQGMTEEPVTQKQLIAARSALVAAVIKRMPAKHRKFLIGFEAGEPDWSCSVSQAPTNCPPSSGASRTSTNSPKRNAPASSRNSNPSLPKPNSASAPCPCSPGSASTCALATSHGAEGACCFSGLNVGRLLRLLSGKAAASPTFSQREPSPPNSHRPVRRLNGLSFRLAQQHET
jgi:hypothetical protein